ncbi:MAG: hypothetical protein Q4A68_00295 [Anaerobiospirillum succiniciproducens]|uniref:hypothetical protein n=1 Tax=Anaerobiospirillum succiniciproducens TaxID=13335 RepID=UPI0026DC068B|nr:hypothetical protein [Anaerobiospirillum succiniciproducens]MDO4675021.1 hypothetical protein [Anaerobiospirillum succiniciproducens]
MSKQKLEDDDLPDLPDLDSEELEALFETIKEYVFYSLAEEDDLIEVLIEEALKRKKVMLSESDFYDLVEKVTDYLHGMAHW